MPARAASVYTAKEQEQDRLLPPQRSSGGKWHSGREIRHRGLAWPGRKVEVVVQHRVVSEPTALGSWVGAQLCPSPVSSELSSRGLVSPCRAGLERGVEFSLFRYWRLSPEQHQPVSPTSEPEEKVEIAVFCKTAGSLLPPSSSLVTLTLTAPGPCRLPLAVAICGFSFPKLLQRHRNSVAAFPKLLPTQTESWFSPQQSCGATRELLRRRGGTDPGRCFPVQLEYQSLQTSLSP